MINVIHAIAKLFDMHAHGFALEAALCDVDHVANKSSEALDARFTA